MDAERSFGLQAKRTCSTNSSQVMNAMVQLTANHRGYFEFRLCPVNDSRVAATDECMAKHPLKIADDSTGSTRFMVDNGRAMNFNISLQLPKDMTCSQCVFQWSYTAGKNPLTRNVGLVNVRVPHE